jgi:HlyD family secretion protein
MTGPRIAARLPAVAVLAAIAAAVAWALLPERVPVEVRPVSRGPLEVRVADDGVTRIKERYIVSAPLAGRMSRVELHAGDPVVAGETPITVIEPTDPTLLDPRAEAEALARVEAARAARRRVDPLLARARVAVEYTAADLERARDLAPSRAMSHEQLDAAERAWKTAVEDEKAAAERIQISQYELAMAEAALLRTRPQGAAGRPEDWRMEIRSPVSGRVLRLLRESAAVVEPGTQLVVVGDPTDLEIVIDLVSEDAVKVHPGDRCAIEAWGGARPLAGRVRLVEPRGFTKISPLGVEEQRVNVIVDIDSPPGDRPKLGDDFRVEAAITVDELADAVRVPLAALFRHGRGEAVFVVAGSRARLVPVRTGRRGDREAEVLEGLAGGEQVVAYPGDRVADGVPVVVR